MLRPVAFMENYYIEQVEIGILKGKLMDPVRADKPYQTIATDDIGAFAVLAFERPQEFIGAELVRLRPTEARHLGCLGRVLQDRGRTDEAKLVLDVAIRALRAAITGKPGRPRAHVDLGRVLGDRGHFDQAVAEYREALRLKPEDPLAHNSLGVTLADQGI